MDPLIIMFVILEDAALKVSLRFAIQTNGLNQDLTDSK